MYAENSLCTSGLVLKGLINKGALWMQFFSLKNVTATFSCYLPGSYVPRQISCAPNCAAVKNLYLNVYLTQRPHPTRYGGNKERFYPYHQSWLTSQALSFWMVIPFASLTFWNENHCSWNWASCKNQPHFHPTVLPFPPSHCILATKCRPAVGGTITLESLASRISPLNLC